MLASVRTGALVAVALLTSIGALCRAQRAAVPRPAGAGRACSVYLCAHGHYDSLECECHDAPVVVMSDRRGPNPKARGAPPCDVGHHRLAVASFQRARGVSVTGVCDTATLSEMRTSRPRAAADRTTVARTARGRRQVRPWSAGSRSLEASVADGSGKASRREGSVDSDSATEVNATTIVGRPSQRSRLPSEARALHEAQGNRFRTSQLRLERYLDDVKKSLRLDEAAAASAADGAAAVNQSASASAIASAAASSAGDGGGSSRFRRSIVLNNSSFAFAKTSLKWRAIAYHPSIPQVDQDTEIAAAFRQWAAVTPLCFANDQTSAVSSVDILIGFYSGAHPGDWRAFDGPGGELAHTYPGSFTHFDSAESWYTGATLQTGIALSAVALHEFGHVVGLSPSTVPAGVMYSNYSASSPGSLLADSDRAAARDRYGPCNGTFDAVVDVHYSLQTIDDFGDLVSTRYYQSFFFRGSYNWLYSNALGRPSDYEPLTIASSWKDLPNSVDAAVQYSVDGVDQLFIFKGSTVYLFSYPGYPAGVNSTYAIATFFPAGSIGEPIPNNLDSAYFDPRDGNIYFFKGSSVYAYRYNATGLHSCCEWKSNISDAFPLAPGQPNAVGGVSYQQNVDAVYYSVTNGTVFFFVGDHVWKNQGFNVSAAAGNNSVAYVGAWNLFWNYVCDVVC